MYQILDWIRGLITGRSEQQSKKTEASRRPIYNPGEPVDVLSARDPILALDVFDEVATDTSAAVEPAPDIDTLLATADVKRGETLYFQCRACHTLNEGGANKIGPNLYGVFGQKAGSAPGFSYSDAVKNSDVVWTPATVSAWLERPSDFLPGNMMVFLGVKKPQDRASLIAFLQQETGAASN